MKIEVNISKKYFFIIIAVIVIAAAVVGVIASHGTSTPNLGHDLEEIGGILVGISSVAGTSVNLDDKVIFRFLSGNTPIKFEELAGD